MTSFLLRQIAQQRAEASIRIVFLIFEGKHPQDPNRFAIPDGG